MKIVVIGGVAGGMSFAARARRLAEDAEIVVLERGPYVSFANCGLPYHLSGEIVERGDLLLHSPASLAASLALDVRVDSEVTGIDRTARSVRVRTGDGRQYDERYDTLVLSTGAAPVVPPLPGLDDPAVHVLRTVPDVDALTARLATGARRVVVVGAGFIGLEAAEAFRHRGLAVTVLELAGQVLTPLDPEMAHPVEQELRDHDIDLRLGTGLRAVRQAPDGDGTGAVVVELTDGTRLQADLVLLAIGVRPDTRLAREAGLAVDERGGIVVDEHLRTSDPSVYAVGDAIQVRDAVTGGPALVPLAGPANRQGWAAAYHLFGRGGTSVPALGTAIVRVFDLAAATTGRNETALRRAGITFHAVHLHPVHHAGYFPGARPLHLKVLFGATDGRLLGAQITGTEGVDKRIDVIATAIRAGMTVADLADLELAYAPPFGAAKDPVNMAGFIGENVLAGDVRLWYAQDLATLGEDAALLDVRSEAEYAAGHLPRARNIPHTQLRQRLTELPPGRPLRIYCASGVRSYLAYRILHQHGWADVATLSGGLATLHHATPGLALATGQLLAATT